MQGNFGFLLFSRINFLRVWAAVVRRIFAGVSDAFCVWKRAVALLLIVVVCRLKGKSDDVADRRVLVVYCWR